MSSEASPYETLPLFRGTPQAPPATDTRDEAYRKLDQATREATVLDFLRRNGPSSNMMIARGLDWSVNRVTGRIWTMRQEDRLEVFDTGKRICKVTEEKVHFWRARTLQDPQPTGD